MKYAQQQENLDWKVIEVSNENDPIIQDGTWYKLIEHEEPHDSFDINMWKLVEHLKIQRNFRQVHRIWEVVPIDAYEPDRPTIIDPQENTGNT